MTCAQEVLVVDENTIIVDTADKLLEVGQGLASEKQSEYEGKTILIIEKIDMKGKDWPKIGLDRNKINNLTIRGFGDGIEISNLELGYTDKTGSAGFIASAYCKELIIENITFKGLDTGTIEDNKTKNNGVGAIIGYAYACDKIEISNCSVIDSKISGGHWAGGLIGVAEGYYEAGKGGLVFMEIQVSNCKVEGGSTITSAGSAGGLIGHGALNVWTHVEFSDCSVTGCAITSTGNDTNKAGSLIGTLGTGMTFSGKDGGVFVTDCTAAGNTVKSNNVSIDRICGRQGSPGGVLYENGAPMAFYYETDETGAVTISIKQIKEIAVTKKPSKVIYKAGESFNKSGMEITAYYTDRTNRALNGTNGYQDEYYPKPSVLDEDTEAIEISFGGKTCVVGVSIVDDTANVIAVETADKLVEVGNGLISKQSEYEGKTILIMNNLDMTDKSWPAIKLNAIEKLTFKGFGKGITISNLTLAQFTNTNDNKDDANGSTGFISFTYSMSNLTFEGITFDKLTTEDASGNGIADNENGVGAFIGKATTVADIAISNCHVTNSKISGGHWTGGFVGYAAGYSGNDGPVFETLTIENSTIVNTNITSPGSAGGLIGHATGDYWTRDEFKSCKVKGCIITSTDTDANNKAGSLIGTVGAGQTKDGKNGGVFVTDCTVDDKTTATSNGTTIDRIYGRQGTTGGVLCVDGKRIAFDTADLKKTIQDGSKDSELELKLASGVTFEIESGTAHENDNARNVTFIGDGTQTVDVITKAVTAEGGAQLPARLHLHIQEPDD